MLCFLLAMIDKKALYTIIIFTLLALIVGLKTVPDKNYLQVLHTLSIGFVLSAIFYFLVVYLPENRRKKMICEAFVNQFDQFRINCITNFLIMSKSQDYENRENLLNRDEFRRYFHNENDEGKGRWYEVANELSYNDFYLKEIVYELRMFNEEIKYLRNTVYLGDKELFNFLNNLSQVLHRHELTQSGYDEAKPLCRFLWEIFTGYNWIAGYENKDFIEKMILRVTKT